MDHWEDGQEHHDAPAKLSLFFTPPLLAPHISSLVLVMEVVSLVAYLVVWISCNSEGDTAIKASLLPLLEEDMMRVICKIAFYRNLLLSIIASYILFDLL